MEQRIDINCTIFSWTKQKIYIQKIGFSCKGVVIIEPRLVLVS